MSSASDGNSDDYYAVLNVPKEVLIYTQFQSRLTVQASLDELKNAYRRLCVLYHPDKHQTEEKQAVVLFFLPLCH
jgi:DnaJ family protein C protein 11